MHGKIDRLGDGGSDYAAFVQHVGVPSANLYFGSGTSVIVQCPGVYPYGSWYEMQKDG